MFNKRSSQKYIFLHSFYFRTEEIHKLHNQKNDSDTQGKKRKREKEGKKNETRAPDSDSAVTGLSVIKYSENWQT